MTESIVDLRSRITHDPSMMAFGAARRHAQGIKSSNSTLEHGAPASTRRRHTNTQLRCHGERPDLSFRDSTGSLIRRCLTAAHRKKKTKNSLRPSRSHSGPWIVRIVLRTSRPTPSASLKPVPGGWAGARMSCVGGAAACYPHRRVFRHWLGAKPCSDFRPPRRSPGTDGVQWTTTISTPSLRPTLANS